MQRRCSIVDNISVRSIAFDSIIEIGDSNMVLPQSSTLAVQRQFEIFYGKEGNFRAFPIFNRPIEIPTISENIIIRRINESPNILVHTIDVVALSSSSIIHIGSTNHINGESRIKHIRQIGTVS